MDINTIFVNVSRKCTERNTSVKALERELGFGENTIYKWRASEPSVSKAKIVADYFGCTVDDLLKEEGREEQT